MIAHERIQGLDCISVPADRVEDGVEELKAALGSDTKECTRCGYTGPANRWGVRESPLADLTRTALVVCCPSCEANVSLAGSDLFVT